MYYFLGLGDDDSPHISMLWSVIVYCARQARIPHTRLPIEEEDKRGSVQMFSRISSSSATAGAKGLGGGKGV